jgi:peptide deformylase
MEGDGAVDIEEFNIRCYPEPDLRKKSRPIRCVDDEVLRRANRMLEFMYVADGVGLAGPQIGWSNQIVTLDAEQQHEGTRIFVNPYIARREGTLESEEGCLSLPGIRINVPRAERVAVVAYTIMGERLELEAEGLAACVWQHELDHLNGVLIIDRVPPTVVMSVREQLRELERQASTSRGRSGR